MNKLNVGDYVRIKNSGINKITSILDNEIRFDEKPIFSDGECIGYKWCYKEDIIKSSPNIIDLIEVGDYVNGCWINEIKDGKPYHEDYNDPFYSYYIENEDIKSVVTKEQFENISYKVGE